jgi:MFS family permease
MSNIFGWWKDAERQAKRSLVAAALGWMLDAFDVMLYAMILSTLIREMGMSKGAAGLLGSLTLVASAFGGMIFGVVADRFGRLRALMGSILVYSVFTAACGLSSGIVMLAVFRVLLGLGMGGEWASGAALVAETWPAEHRGKALGLVQSFWAVGYAAAAAVSALVLPAWGWRAVFFVGVLPAFFTFWVRRRVEEPAIWRARGSGAGEASGERPGLGALFAPGRVRITLVVTLMNALSLFAWWGFNLWIPAFLSLSREQGGVGLTTRAMSGLIIFMQAGMWLGYVSFGYISDALGRKKTYIGYLAAAAVLVSLYSTTRAPLLLLALGPVVAFFGSGYFSGFGALTAELYPTSIRATAQGFTYNFGRIVSAAAPFTVGTLAQTKGFGTAFPIVSLAFLAAALTWVWIPETRGKRLD